MVKGLINGIAVTAPEGSTILEAARAAGIQIPTLCYLKDVNEIGACRVCVVEVKGVEKLVSSCDTPFTEGIEVVTNSPRVLAARRENVSLILSEHNTSCTTCVRSGNCTLQKLANDLNLTGDGLPCTPAEKDWDASLPLQRDASKCVKCLRCVSVCEKVQGLGIWEVNGTGANTAVGVVGGLKLRDVNCALCGQCVCHLHTESCGTACDDCNTLFQREIGIHI